MEPSFSTNKRTVLIAAAMRHIRDTAVAAGLPAPDPAENMQVSTAAILAAEEAVRTLYRMVSESLPNKGMALAAIGVASDTCMALLEIEQKIMENVAHSLVESLSEGEPDA